MLNQMCLKNRQKLATNMPEKSTYIVYACEKTDLELRAKRPERSESSSEMRHLKPNHCSRCKNRDRCTEICEQVENDLKRFNHDDPKITYYHQLSTAGQHRWDEEIG